jgi:hypothetical protein
MSRGRRSFRLTCSRETLSTQYSLWMKQLEKYSIGVGDRFAHQAKAQLAACVKAMEAGVEVIPVWNKSNREHTIIGSEPNQTRYAADQAVAALHWMRSFYCDADHINLTTVDRFLHGCDFFTIDVADCIGKPAPAEAIDIFVQRHPELTGDVSIEGIDGSLQLDETKVRAIAGKFLGAVQAASGIYKKIAENKGVDNFITEVSMDETDSPQTPVELLVILAAAADEKIPLQTVAPKFTGRFNKGVDYEGDVAQFREEFSQDIAAIAHAIKHYGLPETLKLSVHSGSDKFSIYQPIHDVIMSKKAGVHVKTAGTTWLEELIGLAEAGGDGLALAKEIYAQAFDHREELCAPYATVISIDAAKLPSIAQVNAWSSEEFTSALRHDQKNPAYNPSLRQLLHVGFKVAAKMGPRYLDLLKENEAIIARNVTKNLFDRHLAPIFLGRKL